MRMANQISHIFGRSINRPIIILLRKIHNMFTISVISIYSIVWHTSCDKHGRYEMSSQYMNTDKTQNGETAGTNLASVVTKQSIC